jgi:hypothetical protein
MGAIPNETLCTAQCDPITGSGCQAPGAACVIGQEQGGQMRWFTFCEGTGTTGMDAPCTKSTDCLPGFGCYGTPSTCRMYCKIGAPSPCSGTGVCTKLVDQNMMPVVVNGVTLGVCP